MTAEIFLAVFLASLLVAAVQWVFIFTVHRPVQRWMANRAWDKLAKDRSGAPAKFAEFTAIPLQGAGASSGGLDLAVPSDLTPEALRSFNAGVHLQMRALAFSETYPEPWSTGPGTADALVALIDSARAYGTATSPTRAQELRQMAEFHGAMQRKPE
jgi:hypothetical protein